MTTTMTTTEPPVSRSRLEINLIRLLEETQQMANGNKTKDWKYEKWLEDRRLVVLYGSQTGTAQEVAERIGREAQRYFFLATVAAMDDYPIEDFFRSKLVIFVASTTGQGDDPDNMRVFFKSLWARRKNRQLLSHLNFGVIGLGDSSYQKFNYAAKRLNNLLLYLGGQPLQKIGLGDDQHDLGPDFVVDSWLKGWWANAMELYPFPEGLKPIDKAILPMSKYRVRFVDEDSIEKDQCERYVYCPEKELSQVNPCMASLKMNKRVTAPDHFQDVRLLEFDISHIQKRHMPGDVLMVQPQNMEEHVEEFLNVLGFDPERKFFLEQNDPNTPLPPLSVLPRPCTMKECVTKYLDILSVPKRFFFELLAFFTTDETEKEKFEEFASSEGQQDLFDYCNRPKRSIMEVLADFPHVNKNIPFDYLFDLVPPIRPRPYSIASSSLMFPGRAQLLIAVVNYKTILKRPRLGLCTNWLSRLSTGALIPVWIKPGTLTFPPSEAAPPVIMIGPGTGCAPFRSYLQERVAAGYHENLVMIFGCRNRNKDHFFQGEWEGLESEGKLQLYCAFSRDQEDKVYVQHIMRENADTLWDLIGNKQALVYFAGNAKRVPIDVYEALTYICERGRGQGTPGCRDLHEKRP
ncbi:NADPH-dependent diflavin oxidoreductase 1-like [Penaeus monodon]|uniref:NADPH-dependent diflavin oxidoreductase 1-like n=1 Tax=Penaeus monodon TaxID=6687 RepID=UPI0018A7E220|nr:NADPH-dependent diflavin oxidoreductase 1-like [Penaeus monodon]